MLPYLSAVAAPYEPEGWDAVDILELTNPLTKRWSCPTMTMRNRRCESVVSQDRRNKVTAMINAMAIEDAAVIVRDENRELTKLAETMLCPQHFQAADSGEKIKNVVALWKNYIKTSMRSQTQHRTVRYAPQPPSVRYQPSSASSGVRRRDINTPAHQANAIAQVELGPWSAASDTLSETESPPHPPRSNHGADAVRQLIGQLNRLSMENQTLRDTNRTLRAENARLIDMEKTAAKERRQTEGAYGAVLDQRSVLSDQVDGLYREINGLREQNDSHLERIYALQDTVQQNNRTYRRLKKVWTAASFVPKEGDD